MPGGFDEDNLEYPQGDAADTASKIQYEKGLVHRRRAAGVADDASEPVIEQAEKKKREALAKAEMDAYYEVKAAEDEQVSDRGGFLDAAAGFLNMFSSGSSGGTAGGNKLGVQKTKGGIGKKGGGRRTRGRRTRGRRTRGRRTRAPRKTKPHRTKRASSNRGSDWRSHIKRTMKNNPNMKFGKDLLKLASRTFKKGVKPIYS